MTQQNIQNAKIIITLKKKKLVLGWYMQHKKERRKIYINNILVNNEQ